MKNSGTLTMTQWNRFHNLELKKQQESQFELVSNVCSAHIKIDGNIIKTEHKCKRNAYKLEFD